MCVTGLGGCLRWRCRRCCRRGDGLLRLRLRQYRWDADGRYQNELHPCFAHVCPTLFGCSIALKSGRNCKAVGAAEAMSYTIWGKAAPEVAAFAVTRF